MGVLLLVNVSVVGGLVVEAQEQQGVGAAGTVSFDSGEVSFTGTKTGSEALGLPDSVASTDGLELVDASFGGKLLKISDSGSSFQMSGRFVMNTGNTQQVYWKDSEPTSVTDGTLVSGGSPQWSGNTSVQSWDTVTGGIPEGRYYWVRSSLDITYSSGSWVRVRYTYTDTSAPETVDFDSGETAFTGSKTGAQALSLPVGAADGTGVELADASFGGKLLKITEPGSSFQINGRFVMNTGNTQQVYWKDSEPTSVTDGTLVSGGSPSWSGNTSVQSWDAVTGSIPEGRYYWIRSSSDITYSGGSWVRVRYTYTKPDDTATPPVGRSSTKTLSIDTVSGGFVDDTEDENTLTISGTSTGLSNNTEVTVTIDGSGTDVTKKPTTNSTGVWSTTITSAQVKALITGTPPIHGETITVTASATDATDGTASFIYDPTAPGGYLSPVSDGYVNATEDDSAVQVFFRPDSDTASMTTATITDSGTTPETITKTLTKGYRSVDMVTDVMRPLVLNDDDEFGTGVALSGNLLAIGAPDDDTTGSNRGAVYLIKDADNDGDFSDAAAADIITINHTTEGVSLANSDNFGSSIAFNRDRTLLAVGARDADGGRGRVYLIKNGNDDWASIASADVSTVGHGTGGISLSDTHEFGTDVNFSDSGHLLVGAPNFSQADTGGSLRGAVFIVKDKNNDNDFSDTGEVLRFNADNAVFTETPGASRFGQAVAASGGVLAIGMPLADPTGTDNITSQDEGVVYLVKDGGDGWASVQSADVTTLYGGEKGIPLTGHIIAGNHSGSSVALEQQHDGLLIAIGSPDYLTGDKRGAIHILKDTNNDGDYGDTGELVTLKNNTNNLSLGGGARFGESVSVHDGTLAVGAPKDDTNGNDRGKVYIVDHGFYATINSSEFEKDTTPTANDAKLGVGTVTVTATPTDRAGNTGSAITGTFIYDITPPAAPTINLDNADDTGYSSTDNTTKTTTNLTINGCAEADSEAMYYKSNALFGGRDGTYDTADTTDAACTGGTKRYTTDLNLTAGAHTFTAKATDPAGNTSVASSALTVTVDTTAPTLTAGAPDLAADDDTGHSNTDNITNITTGLTLTGTASGAPTATEYIQLYNGTTAITGATDDAFTGTPATGWSIDIPLIAGSHTIRARVLDLAGNEGTLSSPLAVTVDTTAPAAAPTNLALGTGLSALDNDSTPTITMTVGEDKGAVTLYTDSTCTTANVASSAALVNDATAPHTASATATALTADGKTTFYAIHADDAGNPSACSTAKVDYTYDGTDPSISSGVYQDTKIRLTMSEPVYGSPAATDFKIKDDSTTITPTDVTIAATKATASATVTLTVPTITGGSVVKVWYTAGTNTVKDAAGNTLASFTETNAVQPVAAPTVVITPADGSYLTTASADITIDFSADIYSDSTCTTALNDTTAGTITDLRLTNSAGTQIAHTATYAAGTDTISLNPSADPAEGVVIYAALSNNWYHKLSGSCTRGIAKDAIFTVDSIAPTVTAGSTGFYTTAALSTALAGPLKGVTDIYTKVSFSEPMRNVAAGDATARPEISHTINPARTKYEYLGAAYDIDLAAGNDGPTGITTTATGIYVVNDEGTSTGNPAGDKVFAYNFDGMRNSAGDFGLNLSPLTNEGAEGITATDTHFYVYENNNEGIYAYTHAGARASGKDITSRVVVSGGGITAYGDALYVVIADWLEYHHQTTSHDRSKSISITATGNNNGEGVTIFEDTLFVVDRHDNKVYAHGIDGTRRTALDFNLTSANSDPHGIAALPNGDLLVVDSTDDKIYRYSRGGPERYDIIESGTLNSGECIESGAGSTDKKQYTCRYTVAGYENGTFTLKVGTGTKDEAGNALASEYTHATTLTLDNLKPTITRGAYGGTSIVLNMSEKVYGSPAAGDFKVSDDGTEITPSAVTVPSTKAGAKSTVSLTVPTIAANSVVKVWYTAGTNKVKDITGNTLASVAKADAITLGETALIISPISGGYINDAEDENTLTVSGTSTGVASGTTVTVAFDGSGTDVSKTGTTNGGGNGGWSVSLTSAEVKALDATTPAAGGDLITVTASATGAPTVTATFIYDPTAPAATAKTVSGGYVNGDEDDGSVTLVATTGSDTKSMAFTVTDSATTPNSVTKTGTAGYLMREKLHTTISTHILGASEKFGSAIAVSGNILAVGAYGNSDGASDAGAVYTLTDHDSDGDWTDSGTTVKKLSTTIGTHTLDQSDYFGRSVAFSGNILAVGANGDSDGALFAGAVYLLTDHDSDGDWTDSGTTVKKLSTTIGTHTLGAGDVFGSSVTIDGSVLTVGAYGDDDGASNAGAVYTLTDHDSDGDWTDSGTTVKKLSTTIGTHTLGASDNFGRSVSLSGGVLVVGALGDDDGASDAGAVYTLTDHDSDGDWTDSGTTVKKLSTTIGTHTLGQSDSFSSAVSLEDRVLTVGAYGDDDGASNAGAVYTLTDHDSDGDWTDSGTTVKKLSTTIGTHTLGASDNFGSAVVFHGGLLAVGAFYDDTCLNSADTNCGAVYLFDPAFSATLATGDFDKGTPTTGKLTEGTVTVSATPTDYAGNAGTASTSTFTYDQTAPAISRGAFNNTTVVLTMSERVWGSPAATDFRVSDDGTEITPSAVTIPSTAAGAKSTVSLTVPAIAANSVVKAWYTAGTNKVNDVAGNDMASLASGSAKTLVEAAAVITPSDGGYLTSVSGDVTIDFSTDIYSDSGCTTALTDTTAGTITDLRLTNATGTAVAHAATYATGTDTITLNPTADFADGAVVFVSLSNNWYHNAGGTCTRGYADSAIFTVDSTAPTVVSTGTGYYSDSTLSTALSGPVRAGTDIYTKVSFSEIVSRVAATDSTARPELSYTKGSPATAHQYDSISSGAPDSGECVESGTGTDDGKVYTCRYTVVSGDTGSFALKAGTGTADLAGNALASEYTHADSLTLDTLAPLLSKAEYNGSRVEMTFSDPVWGDATAADFSVTNNNVAVTVSSVAFPATAAEATTRVVTLTLGSAIGPNNTTVRLSYNPGGSRSVKDIAGNPLAAISSRTVNQIAKSVTVDGISGGYVNATEDDSTLTVTGTSAQFASGTTIRVAFDGAGTDALKTTTIDSAGDWSVSLTTAELGALDASSPEDDGETISVSAVIGSTMGTGSFVYDVVAPYISSAFWSGSAVTVTVSEPVWGSAAPAGSDFTVLDDGTAATVSSVTTANTVATASSSVTLTLGSAIADNSSIYMYYTVGTNTLEDAAGNDMAAIASGNQLAVPGGSVSVTVSAVSGGYVNGTEDDSPVAVSGTSTGIPTGTAIAVLLDGSGTDTTQNTTVGADGSWSVSVPAADIQALDATPSARDGETITVTATVSSPSATGTNTFIYDAVAPVLTLRKISGGFVDASEDDKSVFMLADVDSSVTTAGVSFSASDGTDTVAKTAASALAATEKLSDAMTALSLTDDAYFGASVSRDGDMLAIGAPYDNTAPANWGAVYLIKDSDGDGEFADADAADVTVINHATAGITLGERDHFGSAVSLRGGKLAIGAYYADTTTGAGGTNTSGSGRDGANASDNGTGVNGDRGPADGGVNPDNANTNTTTSATGAVYIIDAGADDSFKTIAAGDVVRIDASVSGLSLEAGDFFGGSVSLYEGSVLVGAHGTDFYTGAGNNRTRIGTDRGAIYLITDGNNGWADITGSDILKYDHGVVGLTLGDGDFFGRSAILVGGAFVVGAHLDDTGGTDRGAVYILEDKNTDGRFDGTGENIKISSSTAGITLADHDNFGRSVAVGYTSHDGVRGSTHERFLAIGAFGDDTGGRERGAVYLIGDSNDSWATVVADDVQKLHGGTDGGFDLANDDYFGRSVSLANGTLVIGAYGDDTGGDNRGSVHVYNYNYAYNNTYRVALATTDFEKDSTPTDDPDGSEKLAVGTITATASATDAAGNTGTDTETFVYDLTAPTVTSVVYKDAETGGSDLTAITGANKSIYSIITFSEELDEHEASGAIARPVIMHQIGSTGTAVQYDIITHLATLQTGDCKAPGPGSADESKVYTCMYTTPTIIATGDFKTYATVYADPTGNLGTPQTYTTNNDKVTISSTSTTVQLPPTAAERIALAQTTTDPATLAALVPLHPVAVAKNPNCPATILTQLHTSPRKWVRYWVASNQNTPTSVLQTLSNDSDSQVAQAAQNNLNN